MDISKHNISEFQRSVIFALPDICIWKATPGGEVIDIFDSCTVVKVLCEALGFRCKFYNLRWYKEADLLYDLQLEGTPERFFPYISYPYRMDYLTFASKLPDYKKSTFNIFSSFTLSVWIGIFLAIIFISIIQSFIFKHRTSILLSLFYTWNTFCGQFHDWKPKSGAQKVLILSWSVGMTFITVSYASVLLSSLTAPYREKGVDDFNGLYYQLREGRVKVTELFNTGFYDYFMLMNNEKMQFIGEMLKKSQKVKFIHEIYKPLDEYDYIFVMDRNTLEGLLSPDRYVISKDNSIQMWYGLLLTENFCCKKKLNSVIHRVWHSGIFKKMQCRWEFIYRRIYLDYYYKHGSPDKSPVQPLTLSDLAGPFVILIFGNLLALIIFFVELRTPFSLR